MKTRTRSVHILLVEDNRADIEFLVEMLGHSKVCNQLSVARDGEAALDAVYCRGDYAGHRQPDIILLDLNLPRKDGREVLAELKADDRVKHIPVVVLTSSQAEEDVLRTYKLNANCYVCKPVGLERFMGIVQCLEGFWLDVVKLPTVGGTPQSHDTPPSDRRQAP